MGKKLFPSLIWEKLLSNVLYVLEIKYNIVFVYMLGKAGFKVSFWGDKIVIIKNMMFDGKGYCSGKLFKLNVFNIIINEKAFSSVYVVDSIDL